MISFALPGRGRAGVHGIGAGRVLRLLLLGLTLFSLTDQRASAQTRQSLELSVAAYDRALARLAPGEDTIAIGDMIYSVGEIKEFRDTLKARLDGKISALGTFSFANSKQWPNGVVPYAYDKNMPETKKITFEAGIREWQKVANLNFVPRTTQANYISVTFSGWEDDAPMNSRVGMEGGAQTLRVAGWGNLITCAHELGHSLGMIHEQMRSDRDAYVTIYPTNISLTGGDFTVNFALVRSSINRGPYDYDSLMHYGRTAFAIDPKYPTIQAKSPNERWSDGKAPEEIGQQDHISTGDAAAMAAQYGSPLSIEGTVVDAAGNRLAGVQVALSGGAVYRGQNPVSTDANGNYQFTGIPRNSGIYTVSPSQVGTSFTESSRSIRVETGAMQAINFTSIDAAPPDLRIDVPTVSGVYSAAPRVSGTASDTVGLKEVRVALARTSDLAWWDWTESKWGSSTFDWARNVRVANGKTAWSTDLPALNVGGYQVHVQSVDFGDNASAWLFRHFFVDPEPPLVVVTEPVPGTSIPELMHIRGTATDGTGTGIKDGRVYFTLYQNGDFWTGFNWKSNTSAQDPEVLLWADVVNGEWIYNSVPGGHDHGGAGSPNERTGLYALSVFAHDNAGNLTVPKAGGNNVQFTVDNTPPSIHITFPEDGATLTNLVSITGSATDAKSLESVRFYLYSFVNGQFWDGNAWGGGGSAILPVSVDTANGTWRSTANLPSIFSRNSATRLENGAYNIIAFAVDSAGNQTRSDVVVHIEYYPQAIYTAGSFSDSDPNNNNENWDNPANWDGGFVPGAGDLAVIPSGNPTFSGMKTVHALKMTGGDVRGGTLNIPDGGTFSWAGGNLSADLTVQPGGHLNLTGTSTKALASGRKIEHNGDSIWDGEGSVIHGTGGSAFINNGTITVEGNASFVYYNNGVSPVGKFENQGIFTKKGNGILRFSADYGGWVLTNGAAMVIAEGQIILNNQSYLGGTISGSGRLVGEDATLHLDSTTILDGGTVELKSGTLLGAGTFGGDGTFVWSGGTLNGDIVIDTNAHALLTGNARSIATGARLRNRGTLDWDAGDVHATGQSRLENSGRVNINGAVSGIYYNNGVAPRGEFENRGLVTVNNGVNVLFREDYGGWHFNNFGETRVDGKLVLSGGGVSSNSTYNILNGSIELAPGEPHLFSGSIAVTGAGVMRVVGASVRAEAAEFTISQEATYEHSSGTAEGSWKLSGPGVFVWSGGTLNATMDWASNLRIAISGDADKNLEAGRITQAGTVTWTGNGRIRATGGAELLNNGVFNIQNDSGFLYYNNGVAPVGRLVNTGTLRKTSATGATRFFDDYGGWIFINRSLIDLQSGTLELFNSSTLDDRTVIRGAGSLRVISGATTIAGTNTVDGGTLVFANGALSSQNGLLAGPGKFEWSGGAFGGLLNVSVTNFSIAGPADKILNSQSTIRNFGSATWSGAGPLRFTGASLFENHGGFDLQEDTSLYFYQNGVAPRASFLNLGTFIKSGGTNVARFAEDYGGATFDNKGTLRVERGSLHLGGGGSWENAVISVADGSELRLFSGRFGLAGKHSFAGRTLITGGEFALVDSTNSISSGGILNLAGGTLLGTGTIAGPGTLEWSGGAISAVLTIAPEANLALTGDAEKFFAFGTINHYGNGTWNGKGNVKAQGGTLLNNFGWLDLLSDAAFSYYNNGVSPRGRFHNAGQLRKSGGAGNSSFVEDYGGWDFSSTGTIQIDSGTLALRTANSFTNTTVKGAGRVRLETGFVKFEGAILLDGGTFELANGYIDGAGSFKGTGTFEWTGGEIRGSQIMDSGSKMLISGSAGKQMGGSSTLENRGTITWRGSGGIHGIGQSRLLNSGTLDIQTDSGFVYYNNGVSPVGLVENTGTIRKSGGDAVTAFFPDYGGWHFVNSGSLEVLSGTFDVGPNYEPSASSRILLRLSSAEPANGYGRINFQSPANLIGVLAVELADNFAPGTNAAVVLASYPSYSGEFSSAILPTGKPGQSWKLGYEPRKLELSMIATSSANLAGAAFRSGIFQFSLSGPPGHYAVLQSTTNLVDWTTVQTNRPFNGQFDFNDSGATNRHEFYRTLIVQ